ncbi:unnamed protein product [Cyclocybe aegerita]|uniref:Guanine nucleotide-binding protein-like 1 n=1 Tax=Cyclocybe aegerita TaxID=1973307 RepID=A0A8S0VS52_CYCAE|nr:unnamed protein product [Cyclocybe aegerita]
MPPRRKPTSTRQKKADQQLKRAIKRGDVPPPEVKKTANRHHKRRIGPTGQQIGSTDTAAIESARKLQSAFVKLPPGFLEETKVLASNLALPRPIADEKTVFHWADRDDDPNLEVLSCPKRPKWRFDMSKIEVERNEEGVFTKWLAQTDQAIEKWQNQQVPNTPDQVCMPRSTSYFERNLEVWRQLWRVSEISQIILVLLDSRCPILHFPPSLAAYLADRKVILVLTKADITGTARVDAWIKYIHDNYPNLRVVQVESYTEKEASSEQQGRALYEPFIPEHFRSKLVQVIKEVHEELLEPPERVKSHPDRLKNWIPPVKRVIDWDGVLQAKGSKVGLTVGGAAVPRPQSPEGEQSEDTDHRQEPSYLTVGLIGQPNVGKSSLLNALFGAWKVRASKTPGKTKHFQTLYWTADVRLVDCPGLVMPNYVPMEMQVLSGILPISRVSAVPACIYHASQFLPLERIYNLVHPATKVHPVEDKRTWREGMKTEETNKNSTPLSWTAMDILTAYADAKGWVTAKAGRPDVHRAGNAILRAVAEGRIGWAFWPPGTPLDQVASGGGPEQGIWIPRGDVADEETEPESDGEVDVGEGQHQALSNEEDSIEEDDEEELDDVPDAEIPLGVGRFGALAISGNDEDGDESDSST